LVIVMFAPMSEVDPNSVRPGWVALLIVVALGGATFLLWRSMGRQMKKIDFDPDAEARSTPDEPADPTHLPEPGPVAEQQNDGPNGAHPVTERKPD
jgi:hypothetical protein